MDCKSCKWLKIYDYQFEDGTKTITCEKYNKHLGFTNENGDVTKVKHIMECKGEMKIIKSTNELIDKEGVYLDSTTNKYIVVVDDSGKFSIIARVDSLEEGKKIIGMFHSRISYMPNIYWESGRSRWVSKIYDKDLRKYVHVIQTKYYSEAIKKLKAVKGEKDVI